MSLLEQLVEILEEVAWILELPKLLLGNRLKQVMVKPVFLSNEGTGGQVLSLLEHLATILEQLDVI